MAIIKCPECGREISDKARVCPNCGVEIAGKIVKCFQCGEVYFNDQEFCPNCHHATHVSKPTNTINRPTSSQSNQQMEASPVSPNVPVPPTSAPKKSGTKKGMAFVVALIIAAVICGVTLYFYHSAKENKESEAYAFAIKSNDPLVLQTYLDNNMDAPQEHRDSITFRLDALKKVDNDWANALVSGSKTALMDYMARHPESEHIVEARHKVDSIDWADAMDENTLESLQLYLNQHVNGEHVDDANTAIKELKGKTVQSEEKAMVISSLRQFFQSINSKDEIELGSSVAPVLSSFLGKPNASKADVVTFMNKIYKDDITNMNWHLNNDYKIDKKEVGEDLYEYNVNFSSIQKIERTGDTNVQSMRYQIKATINPDGLISAMSMTKILE
ncbi:MAG: zinc ribbon domain-containing protein [Prevotella sp.]|nr:zinc ribbon domain-containing protein [Prevotella sp.]MDD3388396.1 zinc ribbon domain-containing protein [Prevotella sp.]MDD4533108.1 zinc ribbon domain-containing protein [Prevotella sp.]